MSLDDYFKQAIKILSTTLQEFHLVDSNPIAITGTLWWRILFTYETHNRVVKV